MRNTHLLYATLALCSACVAPAKYPTDDPRVEFSIALAPGEGIPHAVAEADTVTLRLEPSPTARVAHVVVGVSGRVARADSVLYETLEPAAFHARDSSRVAGRFIGPRHHLTRAEYYSRDFRDTVVVLGPNSTFEFLQWRAEGTCFVRFGRNVVDAETCPAMLANFTQMSEPWTRLWLFVRFDDRVGWALVADSVVSLSLRMP